MRMYDVGSMFSAFTNRLRCSILVPAYDHELLWEGHSSMIQEIARQLPKRPDAIFCSIGGGGLLGGVIIGCEKQGWDDGKWKNV